MQLIATIGDPAVIQRIDPPAASYLPTVRSPNGEHSTCPSRSGSRSPRGACLSPWAPASCRPRQGVGDSFKRERQITVVGGNPVGATTVRRLSRKQSQERLLGLERCVRSNAAAGGGGAPTGGAAARTRSYSSRTPTFLLPDRQSRQSLRWLRLLQCSPYSPCSPYSRCLQSAQSLRSRRSLRCYPYSPCSPCSRCSRCSQSARSLPCPRSLRSVRLVQAHQSRQAHLVALGCNRQEPG